MNEWLSSACLVPARRLPLHACPPARPADGLCVDPAVTRVRRSTCLPFTHHSHARVGVGFPAPHAFNLHLFLLLHAACAVADRLLDNFQTTQSFSSRQHHVTSIQQYAWDARACILHSSFLTIYLPYIYQKVD